MPQKKKKDSGGFHWSLDRMVGGMLLLVILAAIASKVVEYTTAPIAPTADKVTDALKSDSEKNKPKK